MNVKFFYLELIMKWFIVLNLLILITSCSTVEKSAQDQKAKVILLGTFHFSNPGKDVVKNRVINVLEPESQKYLVELAKRISKFKPTAVLLEYNPKSEKKVNTQYAKYKESQYKLKANEIDQLGFRVAKLSGLERVFSFDERNIGWNGTKLYDQFKREPKIKELFDKKIKEMSEKENRLHLKNSLQDILKHLNREDVDQQNKGLYIMTNVAGVDQNFAGADASASWWHRNFRMLARIQKHTKSGERILVIGGQGHTAVIKDLIKLDPTIEVVDINLFL